jgi:hypothetical protein
MELQTLVYLTPVDHNNKYQRRNPHVKLVEEPIGELLTVKRCGLWLELHFGGVWTTKEQRRLYLIFLTLLERQFERDEDIYYEPPFDQYGVFYDTRRDVITQLFSSKNITVCSYVGAGWNQEVAVAKFGPSAIGEPVSLLKIIRDDVEYTKFCKFWRRIPTIRQLLSVLCHIFPKDVVKIIIDVMYDPAPILPPWKIRFDALVKKCYGPK